MKRSEMIDLMARVWLGLFPTENPEDNYNMDDFYEIKSQMGNVLDRMESTGMRPPYTTSPFHESLIQTWDRE